MNRAMISLIVFGNTKFGLQSSVFSTMFQRLNDAAKSQAPQTKIC